MVPAKRPRLQEPANYKEAAPNINRQE